MTSADDPIRESDSGEISVIEAEMSDPGTSDVDPSTLGSAAPAEPPTSARRSTPPRSERREAQPPSVDDLTDTQRDPAQVAFRPTLPAGERAPQEGVAEPSPNAMSALSRTLDAASRSYDSGGLSPSSAPDTDDEVIADPLLGMVIADRYRIIDPIGRGGMGIVYRVQHVSLGKLLAMKLLTGELSASKEVVRRFKQEAMTVSKLSSPHTVQVFDFGQWNHLTYLVMELVDGYDLGRPLRREGPMSFARLGKLMVQVCHSLAEAHHKGIVHRDIKPENVMILETARGGEMAKVLDFGLAKLRENAELNEVTLQGAVIGTPYYMSPEQVLGEEVDGRTDVYALGAVMFRALTGTQAFQAATPMGMFTKHLTEKPPAASERAPKLSIPKGVSDAIERCMQKDPKDRFQTIEALRDALISELNALGLPSSDRLLLGDEASRGGEADERLGSTSRIGKHSATGRFTRTGKLTATGKFTRTGKIVRAELAHSQIATREELEAYERKLRRTRYGAWALLLVLLISGGAAAAHFALSATQGRGSGAEREPNNHAAEATALTLGQPIRGYLGQRIEPTKGDRDFYSFDLPESGSHVSLHLTALPNLSTCALLFRIDMQQPLGQYCSGSPGADLVVPALRLEPASYLVAVMQDPNPYAIPFVLENVSDAYQLRVDTVTPESSEEVEPNDVVGSAARVAPGQILEGTLAFLGDEDVVCVEQHLDAAIAWEVRDESRPAGSVLEATPLVDEKPGPLVRIHAVTAKPFGRPRMEADVNSPWISPRVDSGPDERCLRLRLTSDPWSDVGPDHRPQPDLTRYQIGLLAAP